MEFSAAAYDEVADQYNETLDPDGAGLHDPRLEELAGELRGRQVLALACGQGRDARRWADLGATVVAVDISERLLTYARRFEEESPRGIRYAQGDAQDLRAFDDASFDVVVCHMALMDIPDLAKVSREVVRVLRPGGHFVASVVHPCYGPHLDVIDGYRIDGPYKKVHGPDWLPSHSYHRSLSTYVNTLAVSGLSITHMVEPPDEATGEREVPNLLYLRCIRGS